MPRADSEDRESASRRLKTRVQLSNDTTYCSVRYSVYLGVDWRRRSTLGSAGKRDRCASKGAHLSRNGPRVPVNALTVRRSELALKTTRLRARAVKPDAEVFSSAGSNRTFLGIKTAFGCVFMLPRSTLRTVDAKRSQLAGRLSAILRTPRSKDKRARSLRPGKGLPTSSEARPMR